MSSFFSGLESNIGAAIGNAATTAENAGLSKISQLVGAATPSTVQTPTGQTVVNTAPTVANKPSFAQIIANIPTMDWLALAIGAAVIGFIVLKKK